jgi:hypothetical protein
MACQSLPIIGHKFDLFRLLAANQKKCDMSSTIKSLSGESRGLRLLQGLYNFIASLS